MRRVAKSWWMRMVTAIFVVGGCGALIGASFSEEKSTVEFDADRYAAVLAEFEKMAIVSVDDLVDDWEWDVYTMLPVAPPDPEFALHVGQTRSRLIIIDKFPKSFVSKLIPVARTADGRSYTAYPIQIQEDPNTRERLVYATGSSKPKLVATIWPPFDYNPYWLLQERYPVGLFTDWLKSLYDPSRIISEMELIDESGAQAIAAAAATITQEIGEDDMVMMLCGWEGGSVTNIRITACERSNNVTELTIAYPDDFTNALDIFRTGGGYGLIDSWWDYVGNTNVNTSTNWISWSDEEHTNADIRVSFYNVWNADIDTDEDGFADGYERLVSHTATNDIDSYPLSVSGSISYTGSLTGPIRMIAVTESNSWVGSIGTTPEPGAYTNDHVANNSSYWFKAYRDWDWSRTKGYGEPWGIYSNASLLVTNDLTGIDITISDHDEDSDGLIDWWEMVYFGDLDETPSGDPDYDGLTNAAERAEGTDPSDYDTDDDGLVDGYDGYCSTNVFTNGVTALDLDADGYADGEFDYGTDPLKADTDDDTYSDSVEILDGFNPLDGDDPASIAGIISYDTQHGGGGQTGTIYIVVVTNSTSWSTSISDSIASTGSYSIAEIHTNSYWIKAWCDSDADGIHDAYEATGSYSTASTPVSGQMSGINITLTDPDDDTDGMGDWWEKQYFDNLLRVGSGDADIDKVSNLSEYLRGTDPTAGFEDTDSDGMSDDWEMDNDLNPNDASDADEDADLDGFSNLEEYYNNDEDFGTDPNDPLSHPSGVVYVDVDSGDDTTGDGSYTNAYASIKKGMASIADGGRVAIFPGTYTGTDNRNMGVFDDNAVIVGVEGASATVIDCEGADRAFWIYSSNTTNTLIRGITIRNGDIGNQPGAAIQCTGTKLTIESCAFLNNQTTGDGGGINANNADISISDSTFINNHGAWGGALYIALNSNASKPVVNRCVFSENVAENGAGLCLLSAGYSAEVRNSLFSENDVQWVGGGIYCGPSPANVVIENCTIVDNIAYSGAGIYCDYSGIDLRNCIVWGNSTDQAYLAASTNIIHSCIQSWTYGGTGNITNDPQFADDVYRLKGSSPCWNAGTNASWMTDSTDLAGQTRLLNETVDMGAYELCFYFVSEGNAGAESPYGTWDTAAATIQDAIDVATGIDPIVLVTNGVYTNVTVDVDGIGLCRVAITNPITVLSVNGPSVTSIMGVGPRGTGAVRCAYVVSNACLSGFTLTNGFTTTEGEPLGLECRGGGAFCEIGGQIEDCLVSGCAAYYGGGISGGAVVDCTMEQNTAQFGGGLYGCEADRCIVRNNNAVGGGGVAFNVFDSSGWSSSCLITSNMATTGGGAWLGTVENCTIIDNIASNSGGGTYKCSITNSIVWTNSPDNWCEGTVNFSCTDPLPSGSGNIDISPDFVSEATGNYRLSSNSLCIDRGGDAPLISTNGLDLEGSSRLQGYMVDMGAYESAYSNLWLAIRPDIGTNRLEISDDGYTHTGVNTRHTENYYQPLTNQSAMAVEIGFTLNFFGSDYTNVFVNNNGNLTFENELPDFTPQFLDSGQAVLATFWADVDTRHIPVVTNGPVLYGQDMIDCRECFGVTWTNAGYFSCQSDRINEFQAILINRSDITQGDFDLEYNYRQIDWETGNSSGGENGLGGNSARVGFGDSTGFGFELPGSGEPGSLISGGDKDLEVGRLNSYVDGRYVFHFRDGWPFAVLYAATMDSDPSWDLEGEWAYGAPLGQDGDPSSGYRSGPYVVGYNLDGAYSNNLAQTSATIGSIDCSGASGNVFLSFRRWLNVSSNDVASIQVSAGSGWTELWNNSSNAVSDTTWKHEMLDISDVAAGQANVSVRWVIGPTDEEGVAGGWNLDEVRVLHIW